MRQFTFLLLFALILNNISAQSYSLNKELAGLEESDYHSLPPLDNELLRKKYLDQKNGVKKFAEPRDVLIDITRNGVWDELKNGKSICRQAIASPNAYSINLGFSKFKLPKSALLYIYNEDRTDEIGPFTNIDNDAHLQLWTPIVKGEKLVIELQIDKEDKDLVELELSRINHDFVGVSFNALSQSCNLDVVCGAADGWPMVDEHRDIIRSVGAYSINGTDACTGVLVNNTRKDCRPFFLTANHCRLDENNSASVVVYWNFENSFCRQPNSAESGGLGDGLRNQFNTGSTFRAAYEKSDFALLELDDPIDPNFNLYFAGWNIEDREPENSICIHHPSVEEKRISFDNDPGAFYSMSIDVTHIEVLNWDIGSTEVGSSGSPLFNEKGQVIGQLEGGSAACGNNGSDIFGWTRKSWTGGGSTNSSLKSWLDPDGLGVLELDGKDCGFQVVASSNVFRICGNNQDVLDIELNTPVGFEGSILYSTQNFPTSLEKEFSFESGDADDMNTLTIKGLSDLQTEKIDFNIEVSDGTNSAIVEITIVVFEDNPPRPQLVYPENNLSGVELGPTLELNTDFDYTNQFQLSFDEDFNNLLLDESINESNMALSSLKPQSRYYWRVRSLNECGSSQWSDVFSFTTTNVYCTTIYSNSDPVEISEDENAKAEISIEFPYAVITEDVNVSRVQGKHSWIEDLAAQLKYNNIQSVLFENECFDQDDFSVGFDDQSTLSQLPCPLVSLDMFQPKSPLSLFNGEFAGGTWSLEILDGVQLDGGEFENWEMTLCFSNPTLPVIIPKDHRPTFCDNKTYEIEAFVFTNGLDDYKINVLDNSGLSINSLFTVDPINDSNIKIQLLDSPSIEEGNLLTLELQDVNGQVLARSFLQSKGFIEGVSEPVITFPQEGTTFEFADFNLVEWDSQYDGAYLVELALDADFQNTVYTFEGRNANLLNIDQILLSGNYYLRVSYLLDCGIFSSEAVNIEIKEQTSSVDLESLTQLKIYPNPAYDFLFIESDNDDGQSFVLEIFDLQGKVLLKTTQQVSGEILSLDIQNLTAGVYIIKIQKGLYGFQQKLVKIQN